ncbi:MAG: UDP-N-acetylmuramoyl-tripeptide--D-alanyl-D-alanine ligase [Flavobacteriia bacterium]|nr:UDP-N-acetylmuramoyl-tripeptide--D-alanyl-D-alanine ligase [Flavobacteriia bacterium]
MQHLFDLFYQTTGVCTDTRALTPNCLFICLKGERFDANAFARDALRAGAKYVITSDSKQSDEKQLFFVEDTLHFLQKLANFHRNKFHIPIIGITGSNGKTTTKELLHAVLRQNNNVLCTQGNFNNHIGVPLTLLQLHEGHDISIVEMGANRLGDIEELCQIAEPTHGLITNIGRAHLEGFGSFEGVLETKLALYRSVEQHQGTIFYNADDGTLNKHLSKLHAASYSNVNPSEVKGTLVASDPYVVFSYETEEGHFGPIRTKLVGAYNLTNFLAAVCVGRYFGISSPAIERALSNYTPSNNRSQVQKTARNTLILDCYNANPSSMQAALISFNAMDITKKLAILGDMLELGPVAEEEHIKIISFCQQANIPLIPVGKLFDTSLPTLQHFENTDQLIESGVLSTFSDTLILIKGSRGIGLEKIIPFL